MDSNPTTMQVKTAAVTERAVFLTDVQWGCLKQDYEDGGKIADLASKYEVSPTEIRKRKKDEGWVVNSTKAIMERASKKAQGIASTAGATDRELDKQATRVANIMRYHQRQWEGLYERGREAFEAEDFNALKRCKIFSEFITILQNGQRKAWGITDKTEFETSGGPGVKIQWLR